MKRTNKFYMDFYKECMKSGNLPREGLCGCLPEDEFLELFKPQKQPTNWCWGYSGEFTGDIFQRCHAFSPMRQTIVLFMAEMAQDEELNDALHDASQD